MVFLRADFKCYDQCWASLFSRLYRPHGVTAHKAVPGTRRVSLSMATAACIRMFTMSKVELISILPTAFTVPSCPLLTAPDRCWHRQFIRPYCSLSVYHLSVPGILRQSSPLHVPEEMRLQLYASKADAAYSHQ